MFQMLSAGLLFFLGQCICEGYRVYLIDPLDFVGYLIPLKGDDIDGLRFFSGSILIWYTNFLGPG